MSKSNARRGAGFASGAPIIADQFSPALTQSSDFIWTNFNGSAGDDIFTGGADNDTAVGNGGNDQLSGAGANDLLVGNAGADMLNGGEGSDTLYSGDETPPFNFPYYNNPYTPPVLDTGTEVDTLIGGGGDDSIFAGYGDNVDGGSHTSYGDRLFISFLGGASGVTVDFRLASQVVGGGTITGIENISWVQGSNYDDDINVATSTANGYSDFTAVFGMGGNDRLVAGYYTGVLDGGDGNDVVDGRGSQYLQKVFGGDGDDTLYTNSNTFGEAYGGAGNDTIYAHGLTRGGTGNDLIIMQFSYYGGNVFGDEGDDEIRAAAFAGTTAAGGSGADILTGDAGADRLYSADFVLNNVTPADDMGLEHDTLAGFGGNDIIAAGYGDDADGGSGSDTLHYSLGGATSGVTFDTAGIAAGTPFVFAGGTINSFETLASLRGSEFSDTLNLATQGSLLTVRGGAGNDLFTSNGSSATVFGDDGDDRLVSGVAGDIFDGGAGTDTVDYSGYGTAVTVSLGLAAGSTGSGAGGDQLVNVENVEGSAFGDTIAGSDQANLLRGNGGDDSLSGNGGDDVLIGGAGNDTMNGGSGNDTFFVDSTGDSIVEAAGGGFDIVYTSLTYTLSAGAAVEVLATIDNTATTAINLYGNELANYLTGNAGANLLDGGAGPDQLWGRGGDDSYYVDAGDSVVEYAGDGYDIVYARSSFALGIGMAVEVLATIDNTATTAINLIGNAFDNYITGNAGANILDSGGGSDILSGREGDDSYFADANDVIIELAGQGNDILYAGGSYVLANGLSIEVLATANNNATTAINLTGNELANYVTGNAGANLIDGGAGADQLWGRGGDDSYYVDAGDDVVEYAGDGYDIVYARSSFWLGVGMAVEVLATIDNTATTAINLAGNALDNYITGNAGANLLDGGGGADFLWGREGDDSYFADSNDTVVEYAGHGNDIIYAGSDYSLSAGLSVEVLATANNAATTAIRLTGNELDNYLIGNAGANTLDGGTGSDTLWGREGDDSYYADGNDVVLEYAANGNDVVYARSSFVLGVGSSVEELRTADETATTAINLTGNELDNVIRGNAGDNVISGGLGIDGLVGNGGADSFLFNTALGAGNRDFFLDFVSGTDKILLDHNIFTGLALGALSPDVFNGGGGNDGNDRIIFNPGLGFLYFDADGGGPGEAISFAVLQPGGVVTASDFMVI